MYLLDTGMCFMAMIQLFPSRAVMPYALKKQLDFWVMLFTVLCTAPFTIPRKVIKNQYHKRKTGLLRKAFKYLGIVARQ